MRSAVVVLALCCALAIAAKAMESSSRVMAHQRLESSGDAIGTREETAFGASAYQVKWSGKGGPPPASEETAFDSSAYPVKWSGKGEPPASEETTFGASAYPVKWSGKGNPPPASEETVFDSSAYPVKWSGKGEPPASEETTFGASAYPVQWSGKGNPPPASEETAFNASAYPVKWSGKGDPPTASEETAFRTSEYPVKWSGKGEPPATFEGSSQRSVPASGYPVRSDGRIPSIPASPPVPYAPPRRHRLKVQTGMLFLKSSLHVGAVLPEGTTFAGAVLLPQNPFSIPLDSKNLAAILSRLKIPQSSAKAKQVAETLRSCEPSDKGDIHMCSSSRLAMERFATRALGLRRAQVAITRTHGQETSGSRYVVAQIAPLSKHVVPCHSLPFPFEFFYCHRPKEVLSLRVQLKGLQDGMLGVTAVVICHMNTSNWDEQYFELLGGERGEAVCHYMPASYVMYY